MLACRPAMALLATIPLVAAELPREVPKIYAQLCAGCHGPQLQGGTGSSLVDGVWKHGDGSDAFLTKAIADGMPLAGMPGFGQALDERQVRGLVIFMREQAVKAQQRGTPKPPPMTTGTITTKAAAFNVEVVAEGLKIPWSLAFLPGEPGFLVTERSGALRPVRDGRVGAPIPGTPAVWSEGQGGLMGAVPHPDYARNGWLYLAFSDPPPAGAQGSMTAVVRGRIRSGQWSDEEVIFRAEPRHYRRDGVHFGCRMVFSEGFLFFSIGDRGGRDHAQDLGRPNGKIHRLHDDGRIPADNPFVGKAGALPSIWSWGHRNPQGLAVRTGRDGGAELWSHEHGPRGGDELNRIERGANYGWPVVTHGLEYDGRPITAVTSQAGFEDPVIVWTPSLAVCGLTAVTGDRFPGWSGDLLVGSLAGQELRRISFPPNGPPVQEVLLRGQGRIRTVHQGPDGLIYVGFDNPGRVVRLVPAGPGSFP
jgi:glucose/arabinose dehydrogenase